MTERTPWWKRKRWIAALVLWLVIAYPLSLGPAAYCTGIGWLPVSFYRTVWGLLIMLAESRTGKAIGYYDYFENLEDLGYHHREASN